MVNVKSESEHMDNWNGKWTPEQLKWKWMNWELDEKYVWERRGFKCRVELYLWAVKVKILENWWETKLEEIKLWGLTGGRGPRRPPSQRWGWRRGESTTISLPAVASDISFAVIFLFSHCDIIQQNKDEENEDNGVSLYIS